tara:strand:- start:2656 stop:3105 length:450 start_codon:yes stop_codon:yes gene_type:complete
MLKTKIPPPIIGLFFILVLYLSTFLISIFSFERQSFLSLLVASFGLGCLILASIEFRKVRTSVNPMNPEVATYLVVTGIFKYTRNPMYLGLTALIGSFGIYVGAWLVIILLPFFIFCINLLQIVPEEAAMKKIFGDEYILYCSSVRRWF